MPLPCICCGKQLESAVPDGMDDNQPYAGTVFATHGHYGSTIFDPMDGTHLEINVCDECLKKAGADDRVLIGFPQPAPPRRPLMKWPLKEVATERAGESR